MRTIQGFLLIVMLAALQAAAQTSTHSKPAIPPVAAQNATAVSSQSTAQPTVAAKAIPLVLQIKKTVAFLELVCQRFGADGKPEFVDAKGTGFFIAYPDTRLKDKAFGYLVTNRHVAECWDEEHGNKPMQVKAIAVRLNLQAGTSQLIKLAPFGNAPWIYPDDPSADLAVLPLAPDQKIFDYVPVPISIFATDDVVGSQGIVEGDKILFTGFFSQFPGVRRIEPIVREGILAMMPAEPITTTTGKTGKAYLGDVHIFNGNSGSPVFVNLGGFRNGAIFAGDNYKLLGVVSGMFTEDSDLNLEVVTTLKGKIHANSGIAMIVPASALRNLLENRQLRAMRDEVVQQARN